VVKQIFERNGISGFYKGSLSPMFGVGIVNAMLFGVYGNSLRFLHQNSKIKTELPTLSQTFVAGMISGFSQSFIVTPTDLIKSKLQISNQYKGNVDCLRKILRSEGISGLFKGLSSTVIRETPSYGFYFSIYEFFHTKFGDNTLSCLNAGGIAGSFAWLQCYPIDVIKTRLQTLPLYPEPGHDKYKGFFDCAKQIYLQEGFKSFYRGLSTCLIRAYPVNAVTFLVYESLMSQLK
jgi:solute carrier family 25 (mitochondrial carnitine/acylcarnitine transporter), member 20/29